VLLAVVAIVFANEDRSTSDVSPDDSRPFGNHDDGYETAIRALTRHTRSRRKASNGGVSGFLIDKAFSFFTYQPPIKHAEHGSVWQDGVVYHDKDQWAGMELLRIGADAGHADSIYTLGDIYFFGNYSQPRNISEALRRYTQLAEATGNSSAQHMIGFIHATGFNNVVPRDQAKAMMYYTFAAEQGNERSQMVLGYRHHVGIGTPKSCNTALKNYRLVARRAIQHLRSGPPGGTALQKVSFRISDDEGGIYGEGASVSSSGHNARHGSGSSTEGAASYDDIIEWLHVESKKGDKKATLQLGKIHYEGVKGRAPEYQKAKRFFLEVARLKWTANNQEKKEVTAMQEKLAARAAGYLGRMYLRGEGVNQDLQLARFWFKRGVAFGDSLSQHHLGLMHLEGLGVEKAQKYAASLFREAADQDYAPSLVRMAVLFMDQGDPVTAHDYLQIAARHGNAESLYYLAEMTLAGMSTMVFGAQSQEATCERAAQLFKSVAEKAESVVSSLKEADESWKRGDLELALIDNMLAAEQGFELAQTNTAHLMDKLRRRESIKSTIARNFMSMWSKWVPRTFTLKLDPALSLTYWTRAAKQMNIDALVKMGDYYLSGQPTPAYSAMSSSTSPSVLIPDAEKAAACYQAAADTHQSGQALWNLGWMHENGIGPMEQDFHLAKRFYDLALEMTSEAYLPVKLALLKLRVRSWWNEFTRGGIKSIQDERSCKFVMSICLANEYSPAQKVHIPGVARQLS
jgi:SEL1 protein